MSAITLDSRRTVKDTVRLPFEKIAATTLPKGYQLSLVICGDTLAQKMNAEYRAKTYKPNVLSFPLSKNEGEIFLNIRKAAREALPAGRQGGKWTARERRVVNARIALLFVHGCLHLAGHDHGTKMEVLEAKVLKKYGL